MVRYGRDNLCNTDWNKNLIKHDLKKSIGYKVQALRKNADVIQETLAEKCDVSWRTISNLERGLVFPSIHLLYNLSQYFNISIDDLLENQAKGNKTMLRLQTAIRKTDDKLLSHIKEYINLLKKHFDRINYRTMDEKSIEMHYKIKSMEILPDYKIKALFDGGLLKYMTLTD